MAHRLPFLARRMNGAYRIERPRVRAVPLILDSPHSGSIYPDDFRHAIDRLTLRRSEDAHVDELFAPVTELGATLVHALFPRSYIDPNRADDDLDLTMIEGTWDGGTSPSSKTLDRGVGLIWRDMKAFGPIYDRQLTAAEVRTRIDRFWRPYHQALDGVIDDAHETFGYVIHLNCHSMASRGDRTTEDGEVARPDFVVSDRDGTTCAPVVRDCVVDTLRGAGFTVAVNDPYKGMELVRRHGRPETGRHSLQIEINRALYMDERTLAKHAGFLSLIPQLTALAGALAELDP